MTNAPNPLGRLEQFDERSRAFPIRELLAAAGVTTPRAYTWSCGVNLDQGSIGACVGFSWAGELAAKPDVIPTTNTDGLRLYYKAQLVDGWPIPHEGSSVLAGAKAVVSEGRMGEYRWAFNFSDLELAIGHHGPAVLGINWYEGFDHPDPATGRISIAGGVRGGHAILANGISPRLRLVHLHNSWGASWGARGECVISYADLERLLSERGEACIPVVRS